MKIYLLLSVFIVGSFFGILLFNIANLILCKKYREENSQDMNLKNNTNTKSSPILGSYNNKVILVMVLNGLGWLFATAIAGSQIQTLQIMLVMSVALIISIIDIKIHKIPNAMILLLLGSSLVFILTGSLKQSILLHFIGFAVALALFSITLLLKSNVGAGDIKYIVVMGFCLGYPDIIKAMMIMSSVILVWLLYLVVSKKGGLKTKFAMGPFISIGFITTLLFQR